MLPAAYLLYATNKRQINRKILFVLKIVKHEIKDSLQQIENFIEKRNKEIMQKQQGINKHLYQNKT